MPLRRAIMLDDCRLQHFAGSRVRFIAQEYFLTPSQASDVIKRLKLWIFTKLLVLRKFILPD